MTIVDTCVIIDALDEGGEWCDWAKARLAEGLVRGRLFGPDIVFAETSIAFESVQGCEAVWEQLSIEMVPLRKEALFLAGKAFKRYRDAGGPREKILPDFYIGALAESEGLPILTRDTGVVGRYFPNVELIAP